MWVPIICCVAVLGFLAVWLGFVPPPHATTLIWIRGGRLKVSRGRVRAQALDFLSDILQEAAVPRGFIAVTPGNRVAFSRSIPPAFHQRLRNVLLNL